MKKTLSFVLALIMLFSVMVSCSSVKDDGNMGNQDTVSADISADSEEAAETEKPWLDNLSDDVYFNDTDFNMLVRSTRIADLFSEEITGEPITDAIFARTAKLENRLGIKCSTTDLPDDSGLWKTTISGSVQAGDGAYDIVFPDYWWGIEMGGYYLDLMSLPYLDLSREYWCDGWNRNDTFYGKLYTAVGDFSLDLIVNTEAVFFNKELIAQFNLENPYDLVKEDRWNSDKLSEMSEIALSDIDGDGKYTPGTDLYGNMCALHAGRGYLYAYGMRLANQTDDGGWALDYYNERFVKVYDTVYNYINNTPSVCYSTTVSLDSAFASGLTLFLTINVGATRGTQLREMKPDFGLVPYPKLDEQQKDYISFNLGTAYAAILKSSKDAEMSAAVLEALCAENHKTVFPVLYEDALKEKYSRDATTAEMLDILQQTAYFDFAFVNDAALSALCNYYFDSILGKQANVTSLYEKRKKSSERLLEKLLDSYREE